MDRLDGGRESDASIIARRELHNRAMDLSTHLETALTEKEMPAVTIKKRDLGRFSKQMEVGLDEEITLRPAKAENEEKWWEKISWIIQKEGAPNEAPEAQKLTGEEVSQEEIRAIGERLPRTYKPMRNTEKCYLYKDKQGTMVGWTAVDELSKKEGHLSFVTVGVGTEGKGYGSEIVTDLQKRYDSLSLSPMPYDLGGHKGVDLAKRLFSFYAKCGFVYDDSGFFWGRNIPNLETLKRGETIKVSERMIASGTNIFSTELMEAYLKGLIRQGALEKTLTKEEVEWAREYIDVRKQYRQIVEYS